MKIIFGNTEVIFNEGTHQWDSDHEIIQDALNSRLFRERDALEIKDYSVEFAVKVAKKQMSFLEFVELETKDYAADFVINRN